MQRKAALHLLGGALAFSASGCGWDQHNAAPVPQGCGSPSLLTSFGANIYGSDDIDRALGLIAACGSRFVRIGLDGNLQRTDAVMLKAAQHGLRVLLISQYSAQPVDRTSYARQCGEIHRRYAQYNPVWEIWNEPNLSMYWGAQPNVSNYAKLAKATGAALRANGATDVWSGGTSGIDVRWSYALKQQGVFEVLNGCAVHSYKPAPAAFAEYVALQKLLPIGMPIHTTETCVPSDTQDQSEFLREMWYIHRRLGLPTLIWCELRDFTAGDHAPYNYPYGLLWSTYRPKDAYYTAKSLTSSCD
jgi:hypothetical protein